MAKILNTPTYTFEELEQGLHPDDFVGESNYRHIRVDWEYNNIYPSYYTYPSLTLYPRNEEEL